MVALIQYINAQFLLHSEHTSLRFKSYRMFNSVNSQQFKSTCEFHVIKLQICWQSYSKLSAYANSYNEHPVYEHPVYDEQLFTSTLYVISMLYTNTLHIISILHISILYISTMYKMSTLYIIRILYIRSILYISTLYMSIPCRALCI